VKEFSGAFAGAVFSQGGNVFLIGFQDKKSRSKEVRSDPVPSTNHIKKLDGYCSWYYQIVG
jgi:hypothetical protein